MSRGPWIFFGLGMVMWISYASEKIERNEPIPVAPPLPPVVNATLKSMIDFLGLAIKIKSAEATEKKVVIYSYLYESDRVFYPERLIKKYSLNTNIDVEMYDKKAVSDLRECTKIANRETNNHLNFLEVRIKCLSQKGYEPNDMAYIGGKLHDYP